MVFNSSFWLLRIPNAMFPSLLCTQVPGCYFANSPQLQRSNLPKLNLDSLFYMFYGMPKDAFQALAAEELYKRDWRYHGEAKLWFKRAVPGDGVDLGDGSPKYIYFDYTSWDRHLFTGDVQQIVGGFLSQDDVRVQVPATQ
jgi:CCR4-NOT transcription complex subunit 2